MCHLRSKRWWGLLTYTVMSVFVGWHTLAMVVGPAPDSDSMRWFFPPFKPYLTLFHLNSAWGFFAPNVHRGSVLRYTFEDATGKRHVFEPTMTLNRFDPFYARIKRQYRALMVHPQIYGDSAAAVLCRQHASLHPAAISFVVIEQKVLWPKDYKNGKRPLDAEFVTVTPLKRVQCPGS